MGCEQRELRIIARVSRHGGDRQAEADALWERLRQQVTALVESDEYADIEPMVG